MTDRYAELRAALADGSFDFDQRAYINDVRALLAERDDLLGNGKQAIRWAPSSAHWSNELKRLFGDDARLGIDALESQLRNAQSERDALRGALKVANDALEEISNEMTVGARWTNAGQSLLDALPVARAALAQEQGEEHDNQD